MLLHVPVVLWAALIVTTGFECPLTPLERALRVRGGVSSYDGGFVDHYLDGVVYPGRYTTLARLLVAALVVAGYVVAPAHRRHGGRPARRRRRRSVRRAPVPPGPGDAGAISYDRGANSVRWWRFTTTWSKESRWEYHPAGGGRPVTVVRVAPLRHAVAVRPVGHLSLALLGTAVACVVAMRVSAPGVLDWFVGWSTAGDPTQGADHRQDRRVGRTEGSWPSNARVSCEQPLAFRLRCCSSVCSLPSSGQTGGRGAVWAQLRRDRRP